MLLEEADDELRGDKEADVWAVSSADDLLVSGLWPSKTQDKCILEALSKKCEYSCL